MWKGLLPLGSVVKLKKGTKQLMIIGISQNPTDDESMLFDYTGVLYPEGYYKRDMMALFNHDEIDKVYYIGYMDKQQHNFMEKLLPIHEGLKSGKFTPEELRQMTEEMIRDKMEGGN